MFGKKNKETRLKMNGCVVHTKKVIVFLLSVFFLVAGLVQITEKRRCIIVINIRVLAAHTEVRF